MGYQPQTSIAVAKEGAKVHPLLRPSRALHAGRSAFYLRPGVIRTGPQQGGSARREGALPGGGSPPSPKLAFSPWVTAPASSASKPTSGPRRASADDLHGFDEFFGNLVSPQWPRREPEAADYPRADYPNFKRGNFGPRGVLHLLGQRRRQPSASKITGPLTKKQWKTADEEL